MSEINFRPVKEEDVNDVFILLNQLKQIDLENIERIKAWNKFSSNTSSNSIVGFYNNKIVAYGSVVIENKIRGEAAGHIEDIVVDAEVRGKMVGVSLIKELIEISRRKGCYRITLFCDKKLINFYSRNGFKVNNVIMKKYLSEV